MTPKAKFAYSIFTEQNYTCQYCRTQFPPEQPPLHLHRRVFGSQGGKYDKKNCAACCWRCHARHGELKGAKTMFENDCSVIRALEEFYKTA